MPNRGTSALLALVTLLAVGVPPAPGWAAGVNNRCAAGGLPRPDDSGVGGTGARPIGPRYDDSGIGGTGVQSAVPDDDDSGVGGTGITAGTDTGVIGTITGFGSVCVGGTEIRYGASSDVRIDGVPSAPSDLAVGQVVEVVARGAGNDLDARHIEVHHVVAGQLVGRSADGSELDVMGQRILVTAATRLDDRNPAADTNQTPLAIGTYVRVSGLRQPDGTVVATRLTTGGDPVARLAGRVDAVGTGEVTIAGTLVRIPGALDLSLGDEVRITGTWSDDALIATSVEPIPPVPFGGRVGRLAVEGFARMTANGEVRIGPYRFDASPGALTAAAAIDAGNVVRIEATVRNGRAVVDRIDVPVLLPPRPDLRDSGVSGRDAPGDRPGPDARAADPRDQPPPGALRSAPPDAHGAMDAAAPPDRPPRPNNMRPPERPPHIDRPPPFARPELPQRPERPPRPLRQ